MIKKRHYVNNADFTAAVVEYQKACRRAERNKEPLPQMPKYIGDCILQICNRLTKGINFNFSQHTYRDEMVADAIERCCYAILKFNAKKSKSGVFSYMTTVAIHAMKKRINDERKQNYVKHKFFQVQHTVQELEGMAQETNSEQGASPNDQSYRVVQEFEDRQAAKKLLTKKTKSNKIRR